MRSTTFRALYPLLLLPIALATSSCDSGDDGGGEFRAAGIPKLSKFHAVCTSKNARGDESRARFGFDEKKLTIGVRQPEHPDDTDQQSFTVAKAEDLPDAAVILFHSPKKSQDPSLAGVLVLKNDDRKALATDKGFQIFQSTNAVFAHPTPDPVVTNQTTWTCERAHCETLSARFNKCIPEEAQGCFDIFESELFACCDGASSEPAACKSLRELR